MSSRTEATIPTIDFSKQDLKPGSPEWDSVKFQVRKALEEYGCFEALLDQLVELQKPITQAMEELFDLPLQTKELCVSDELYSGYIKYESGGLLESLSINDANVAGNIEQRAASTLWPQGNKSFSETMISFTKLVTRLEKIVAMMILESFDIEKYIDDQLFSSANYHLRLMKYRSSEPNKPTPGLDSHRDINILSFLYQNDVNGLELQIKDGEWMDVKQSPNSIIVMIGENLSAWLNGRLPSPFHRVTLKESKVRYCVGMFSVPKGGYLIKIPKELVDEKNPLRFKPYDYDDFKHYFAIQRKKGVVHDSVLAYCGI